MSFQSVSRSDLLRLEIEVLKLQLQSAKKDLISLRNWRKENDDATSTTQASKKDEDQDKIDEELMCQIETLNQNRIRCQVENTILKDSILNLKAELARNQGLKLDKIIQESLSLKHQIDALSQDTKEKFKDVKAVKAQVPNMTSLEKLEMPLRFLKQNQQHLSPKLGQDFLRHLTTSLLENLLIKDKSLQNIQAQNINLSQRLADLSGHKDATAFYNPHLEVLKKSKNDLFKAKKDPIV